MLTDTLLGFTSVVCFSLPVVTILFFRLFRHISLLALLVYYTVSILRCINSNSMPPELNFRDDWAVLYNYLETPLTLLALLFFSPGGKQQKVHFLIGGFIVYEMAIAVLYGFSPKASLYVMVPGLLLIASYSLFLFGRQLRFSLTHGKNGGRLLMLGALVFSYCSYLALFLFYFFMDLKAFSGIYTLFFLSSGISAVMMSAGLYLMRHRIIGLQELKVTRREMKMVFGS
jgi:hypothetical protein